MYCTQCGQQSAEGARFCSACGARLPEPGAAAATPVTPATGPPATPYTPPAPEPSPYTPPDPPRSPYEPPLASDPLVPPSPTAPSVHEPSPYAPPESPGVAGPPRPAYMPAPPPQYYAPPVNPHSGMLPGAPPAPMPAPRYAGFWRRFWGLAVDRFLLGIVLFPVGLMFGFNMLLPFANAGELTSDRVMDLLFGGVSMMLVRVFAEWVYFSGFQGSSRQATPGQMLLGVHVTGLDGRPIGFARSSGRYFASWISSAVLLIGFIMALFTERRQTLHDMIASTLVVRDDPRPA